MKMGWIAAELEMIEEGTCPCCSTELVEMCCIECGEVYG